MTPGGISLSASESLSIPDRSSSKISQDNATGAESTKKHKLCRHCERRLPLFRALTGAHFCSDGHEREYRELIEFLGLQRLRNAAERIRAAATPAADPSNVS